MLVTNLRPGPLQRLGLDHDVAARPSFPRLVHCQAQGFRSDTEESARPAYDDIIQALTGYAAAQRDGVRRVHFAPSAIADKVAGMFIAQGVLAALVARATTGRGQRVEVPMFDAALGVQPRRAPRPRRRGRRTARLQPGAVAPPWSAPHARRHVALMPYTDAHWNALFAAVGKEELLEQPFFADHRSRLTHADEVYGMLASIVAERTTDEWIELGHANGIPVAPVPPLAEIVAEPAHHRGVLSDAEHPVIGPYRQIKPADRVLRFRAAPAPPGAAASAGHGRAAHELAGYDAAEIADLARAGVVRMPRPR